VHAERWLHAHGCQRWFNMLRDTASDQVIGIYAMGESRPDRPKT
jgi:sarcosine oxidase subunit delta